jgi:lysophospholipase L1-like esterase
MKIHCFGDSWTEGIGVELPPGSGRIDASSRYDKKWDNEKANYSWPGQLQSLISATNTVVNKGFAGASNDEIYKEIIQSIWSNTIKKGDVVIVGLSSIIRQPLHFLYTQYGVDGFTSYSNSVFVHYKNGFMNDKLNWIESIKNKKIKDITNDVYMDYIVNRFDYDLLYELNMHYICNLQIYLEKLGVSYIFFNAFENNLSKNVKFYNQIRKENWILPDYTIQEYLIDKSQELDTKLGYSVWEDDTIIVQRNQDGPHPNRIGYKIIADLIYSEIIKKGYFKNGSII